MERYRTEKSLELVFTLPDPNFSIFKKEEQLCFIVINAIMARYYIKNRLYVNCLVSHSKDLKGKILSYSRNFRSIL